MQNQTKQPTDDTTTPRRRSYVQHRGQGLQKQPRQLVLDPKGYEAAEGVRIQGPAQGATAGDSLELMWPLPLVLLQAAGPGFLTCW